MSEINPDAVVKVERDSELSVAPSCKDCRVGRGYRPFLDYVELCPLHAAAPTLKAALVTLLDCETNISGCSGIKLLDAVDQARTALALATGENAEI